MPYLRQFLASQCGGPGSVEFVVEKVAGFSFILIHHRAGTVGLFETAVPSDPFLPDCKGKRGLIQKLPAMPAVIFCSYLFSLNF